MERITLKVKDSGQKSILKKPAKTPNKDEEQEDHKPESMEDQQLADPSADEHEE